MNPKAENFIPDEEKDRPIIIAGFPTIGKSYAKDKHRGKCVDLESSDFHWDTDEDGKKVTSFNWPTNYVEKIKELYNESGYKYICISTHQDVLKNYVKTIFHLSASCR